MGLLLLATLFAAAASAQVVPTVVNTTADNSVAGDGFCTLREAIDEANLAGNGDCDNGESGRYISFDIPTSDPGYDNDATTGAVNQNMGSSPLRQQGPGAAPGVWTIRTSGLPALRQNGIEIDGFSQPGTSRNSSFDIADGSSSVLRIEITSASGPMRRDLLGPLLTVSSNGNTIGGLVINGSGSAGIFLGGSVSRSTRLAEGRLGFSVQDNSITTVQDNFIGDNFIGVRPDGVTAQGSFGAGIQLSGFSVIVQNNEIGSFFFGPRRRGFNAPVNVIGNATVGILSEGSNAFANTVASNLIGLGADAETTISNGTGVRVTDGSELAIIAGSIDDNIGLGIDNGDAKSGGNIGAATITLSNPTATSVDYAIQGEPNTTYGLSFYFNEPDGDVTEGQIPIGDPADGTDGKGDGGGTFVFDGLLPEGGFVTATATKLGGLPPEVTVAPGEKRAAARGWLATVADARSKQGGPVNGPTSEFSNAVEIPEFVAPEGDNGQPSDAGNIVDSPAQTLPSDSFYEGKGEQAAYFYGFIGNGPEADPGDDVDCFTFNVLDADDFSAFAYGGDDDPQIRDPQFHLYDANGILALYNDDDFSNPFGRTAARGGGGTLYPTFRRGELADAGYGPGTYTLCISDLNQVHLDSDNGDIYSTGDGPLDDYDDEGDEVGSYEVDLFSVGPASNGTVSFATIQQAVNEGDGSVDLVVTVDSESAVATDVTVTLVSGDPADLGGFTSETVTVAPNGGTFTVTVPITDDAFVEDNETFSFALSTDGGGADGGGLTVGGPAQMAVVVVDNDGPPVTVTVTPRDADGDGEEDGGPRLFSLPINGVTASQIAEAAGGGSVFRSEPGIGPGGTPGFVEAEDDYVFEAGEPILADVAPGAELTFSGSAPDDVVTYPVASLDLDGGTTGGDDEADRVLFAVGNPTGERLSLGDIEVTGGTLADVALVFDAVSGAFRPVQIGDGQDLALGAFEVVVLQVIPDDGACTTDGVDDDCDGVAVSVATSGSTGTGDLVGDEVFTPSDGETAVVLALRPPAGDGATAQLIVDAPSPGDTFALRLLADASAGLDPSDAVDLESPGGAMLASPGPAGAGARFAAESRGALAVGESVTVPLVVAVPQAGTYEFALAHVPGSVDGRPVVVEVFDGTTATVVTDGAPFVFEAGEDMVGPDGVEGRFSVRVSVISNVATEGDPALAALAVYPNPTAGRATVALSGMAGTVRVAVYDALGREVARLHEGVVAAGAEWPVDRLAPGVYVVRAEGPDGVRVRSLTVVR
ncbi:T9SS type A sorting domain-containing protein [Rubrivirga sp. IMCC43871]|uniref:T9SS type A sorting domain-containing protein n=1 Tax=Rubrivirga sp. IMCC43871 TaxID=3391575 RepID=UPI00398FD23B